MDRTGIARRMLDLQTEYARYDENEMILSDLGMEPDRSREDIAADYATALAEFVAAQTP